MKTITNRRDFLKEVSKAYLGFCLILDRGKILMAQDTFENVNVSFSPFISINTTGQITFVNPNPDLGQGSSQASAALLAEEMEVSLDKVKVVFSSGKANEGAQIAGGSGAVRRSWEQLRMAGAAAKEMLIRAAAETWKVSDTQCKAENGKVINLSTKASLTYGELVEKARLLPIPEKPKLKSKEQFNIIGKATKRADVLERITGKMQYGIDVLVPDMLYAAVLHSPSIMGKLQKYDDKEALKVNGVVSVLPCKRTMPYVSFDGLAVVADSYWSAMKGRKALIATWGNEGDHLDTEDYFKKLYKTVETQGHAFYNKGNFDEAFQKSEQKLDELYECNFVAHTPIEPECAVVHVRPDGKVEVWAAIQSPVWIKDDVSKLMKISKDNVIVHVYNMGGSFGRKAYHDYLLEACELSQKMNRPVKVIWSREDDLTQGPYRCGGVSRMQGSVKDGKIETIHHYAVCESIDGQLRNDPKDGELESGVGGEIGFEKNKYQIENVKISTKRVATDIPIMWWRSVYAGSFTWAQECFIDELAHQVKKDPLLFRLAMFEDKGFRKIVEVLAEKSNYKMKPDANTAMGVAMFNCFGSTCAICVTVAKTDSGIKVTKVVSVIDCGICVNPDMVKAQTSGNVIMGLSAATKEKIEIKAGVPQQTNFHQYAIIRNDEIPEIDTYIIADGDVPGGVGEPGLPPLAPALGNAIFNLTGVRVRKLPIDLNNIQG
jgi:isoquinoline 1-oxidoreductase beta subunit